MAILNPSTDKFRIEFSQGFYPENLTKKYDNYLFHLNSPFKSLQAHLIESIQSLTVPGINLNTISALGMPNLGSGKASQVNNLIGNKNTGRQFPHTNVARYYPGTASQNEVIDGNQVNITFRNTIINWCYLYEVLYSFYKRSRDISDFYMTLTMLDTSEVPMLRFKFGDCFIAQLPGLEFSYNQAFRDARTIDAGLVFNRLDIDFLIPSFNLQEIDLSSKSEE